MVAGDRAREADAPPRGKHEPLRHTARNDGTDRPHRGDTRAEGHALPTDEAGGGRKRGRPPTKIRMFRLITPSFWHHGALPLTQGGEKPSRITEPIGKRAQTLTPC